MGGHTYDIVKYSQIAYEGGRTFGLFMKNISDIPVDTIYETLPNFHDIYFRLDNFKNSIKNDCKKRLKFVADEVKFINKRAEEMLVIHSLQRTYPNSNYT